MTGFLVRHRSEALTVDCPCGQSTRILTRAEGATSSLHVTRIRDSVRHYHARTTEVYYILTGSGKIELNGEWFEVRPETAIWIDAGTRHRLVSDPDSEVTTVVMATPAFDPTDEYFD